MKSGWTIKKLGELGTIVRGKGIRRNETAGSGLPCIRYGEIYTSCNYVLDYPRSFVSKDVFAQCPKIKEGDVVFTLTGENKDEIAKALAYLGKEEIAAGGDLAIWRNHGCDPKFLAYMMYAPKLIEAKARASNGDIIVHASVKKMLDIEIPIPPLPEQKRIVAKIDAAFEKIDKLKANAERNLANAKELFQSALDEAMRPKKGWVEKRLGEVCDGRLSYGTSAPSCPYNGKVRYIRITDIDDEGRLLDELVSPKTFERKHILVEGDIVLARTGATVGKSYLYSSSDGDCVYAGYLIRARVNRSMVLPEFAFYFTKTGSYWRYIHAEQAAAAQPNVNAEKYGNLLIPVPPLKEQREIVTMARVIHEKSLTLQQHYTQQIADCAEMRQSVLCEAFEGRL